MNVLNIILSLILLNFIFLFCNSISDRNENPSPLILVPGDGGSRLYAYWEKDFSQSPYRFWVNYIYLALPNVLTRIAKLRFDPRTNKTSDADDFKIIVPGWGDTRTIEQLDVIDHSKSTYFGHLVKYLLKNSYYKRNETLRGAPYDFRKAPNEMNTFFKNLQELIEETYNITGNKKVVLLSHSLGCLYTFYFLQSVPLIWKMKYIKTFVSVSGPFGGSADALLLETTGISFGGPAKPLEYRNLQRSFPSTPFLLPNPDYFKKNILIKTENRSYTANDYKDLFKDMNFTIGYSMYKNVENLIDPKISPSGIRVYCIHGIGYPTVESYFITNFSENNPNKNYGPGDGKVNFLSLELCKNWQNVSYHIIPGANHGSILENAQFLAILNKVLLQD